MGSEDIDLQFHKFFSQVEKSYVLIGDITKVSGKYVKPKERIFLD